MITTEEIMTRVYQMLTASDVAKSLTGSVCYERHDYTKEDIVVVSKGSDGDKHLSYGSIVVNVHVPDIKSRRGSTTVYDTNFPRLIELRSKVIETLQDHYERGKGYDWTIGRLDPPMKEVGQNEHFVTVYLEVTIRKNK